MHLADRTARRQTRCGGAPIEVAAEQGYAVRMPAAHRRLLPALGLTFLVACSTPPRVLQLRNASATAVPWVDCTIRGEHGGFAGGCALEPHEEFTVRAKPGARSTATVSVHWHERGEAAQYEVLGFDATSTDVALRLTSARTIEADDDAGKAGIRVRRVDAP